MTSWEPEPQVTISRKTAAAVLFVAACFFAAGVLLYWGGLG
jgi:membrane protein insertase Oxa1/YidC/SpoIIIJ